MPNFTQTIWGSIGVSESYEKIRPDDMSDSTPLTSLTGDSPHTSGGNDK